MNISVRLLNWSKYGWDANIHTNIFNTLLIIFVTLIITLIKIFSILRIGRRKITISLNLSLLGLSQIIASLLFLILLFLLLCKISSFNSQVTKSPCTYWFYVKWSYLQNFGGDTVLEILSKSFACISETEPSDITFKEVDSGLWPR